MLIFVQSSLARITGPLGLIAPLTCAAALCITQTAAAQSTTNDTPPKSSFYTVQSSDQPLGLLKKRTTSAEPTSPAKDPQPQSPAPAQNNSFSDNASSAKASSAAQPPAARPSSSSTTDKKIAEKASTKPATRTTAKSATENPKTKSSSDNLQADLAAVAILRTNKSSSSDDSPRESTSREKASEKPSTSRDAAPDTSSSESDSENSGTESETASAPPLPPVAAPPAPAPETASLASAPAVNTPEPAPAPNLYLPQAAPERSGSFLSRLFHRNRSRQAGSAATAMQVPLNFNSDYATRDSDDVCPVVLPGMGINGMDIPIGSEDNYRLTSSLPTNFRPTDLILLPNQYCHYGNPLYLRREAAASLCQMIGDAARQGYTIRVVSAFRDYSHQMRLYTQAVARGGENQKSVARPGRSEHFLGTTVDLTNNETHALKRSFGDTPEGKWLAANAGRYGWKMTVMSSNARRSHNEEPWHLRYLGDTINNPSGISPVAQQSSQPQRRDVFGSIGRFLGLRR